MIAVVGGGISGLAVGYHLRRLGREVVVFEAGALPGGVIRSFQVEGRVLECGPQRLRLTPTLRKLVAELGLEGDVLTAPELPMLLHADGRLHEVPLSLRAFLTTKLLSPAERARALLEPLTAPLLPDETAAEFLTRKFGRRAYERLAGPLFGGLYASDPADMPARHALAPLLAPSGGRRMLASLVRGARALKSLPACSFSGGLATLTGALAASLGPALRLATPVRGLVRDGDAIRILHGYGETPADRVVLACPADVAGRLVDGLDAEAAARLAALRYNPVAVAHMLASGSPHGLGYQRGLAPVHPVHGVTWNHAMFGTGREGLHTVFLGGARSAATVELPDEAIGALAAAELREVAGLEGRAIHVHRTRMPAWDRSWDALDGLRLPGGVEVCANWHGRAGVGGRLQEAERLAARLAAAGAPGGAAAKAAPVRAVAGG